MKSHVAEILLAVAEGQLERLGARVNEGGAVVPELLQVVALEDVQGEELGRPLARRGILVDVVAAIARRHRRFDDRAVGCEIVVPEQPAVLLRELRHRSGDISLVKAVARRAQACSAVPPRGLFRVDQFSQRPRGIEVPEDGARLRGLAARHVEIHARRILLQFVRAHRPRQPGGEHEPLFENLERGLQHLREGHRAPPIEHRVPGVHDARNGG